MIYISAFKKQHYLIYVCMLCVYVCNMDGKYRHQIPMLFVSEEVENGSWDAKGKV